MFQQGGMRPVVVAVLVLVPLALLAALFVAPEHLGTYNPVATLVGGASATGGSLAQVQRISQLEQEVQKLRQSLADKQAAKGKAGVPGSQTTLAPEASSVTIDLFKYLGLQSYFAGVSWDPYGCFPPPKTIWPKVTDDHLKDIEARIVQALAESLARIKKVDVKKIDVSKPYHQQFDKDDESVYTNDPDLTLWRQEIMVTLSPFMVNLMMSQAPKEQLWVQCSRNKGRQMFPDNVGKPEVDCRSELSPQEITNRTGYYAMPYESIRSIAHGYVTVGICTSQIRDHAPSYAHWIRKYRMFNRDWATFAVQSPEQDAVVLLFDLLYEKLAIFTRQYWLGVITMQNPFDMYSIQDILFQTRPSLMIETGTANGGSALLWASILHLASMSTVTGRDGVPLASTADSKIITIDMNAPKWDKDKATWGGVAREDPTQHKLWKKHVTFLQGSTTDGAIVEKVKAAAQGQKVMVLLDSHHSADHVEEEMDLYCPLVSVGCYCIVEDTKMSRWSSTGPLEAVKKFMAGPHGGNFQIDRDRELMYSHHAMGYLKRIK